MGIGYTVATTVLAARAYENWAEVITATTKKQEPTRVILKNGLTIEAEVGLRFLVHQQVAWKETRTNSIAVLYMFSSV